MNKAIMNIICDGCSRVKAKIEDSGSMHGVDYVTFDSKKKYIIVDNPAVSWDKIMKERENFVSIYVPKFGKYEIEAFVGHKMMEALLITQDITGLFNSELLCDDSPFNVTRINSDILRKRLLKCFDIVTEEKMHNSSVVKLMFKWKPYYELEE